MMPGAWVEEQKRGREHSLVPEEKAGIFASSDWRFRFIGTCIPNIIAFPNACALVGSSRRGLCYSYCRLEVTFCQFPKECDLRILAPASGSCATGTWFRFGRDG